MSGSSDTRASSGVRVIGATTVSIAADIAGHSPEIIYVEHRNSDLIVADGQ